ncbi:MAG: peptide deformylase [bacterium]|nr:peptide deformylase [bacterium]
MELVKEDNPILHRRLKEIPTITPDILAMAEEMKKKMIDWEGIGLAANQIGEDIQLFVIHQILAEDNAVPDIFINPEITEYSNERDELEEGCLSIPGHFVLIKRAKKIKIKALDKDGKKIRFKAKGFLARVLQHETDHLNGMLIKDRAHA